MFTVTIYVVVVAVDDTAILTLLYIGQLRFTIEIICQNIRATTRYLSMLILSNVLPDRNWMLNIYIQSYTMSPDSIVEPIYTM